MQVCSLKSALGSAPAELTLSPISDAASLAGWKIDSAKVTVAAGERKPIKISLSVPAAPRAGSAAAFGQDEYAVCVLEAVATGGSPALPQGGQHYRIIVRALVKPHAPPAAPAEGAAAASGEGKKSGTPKSAKKPPTPR